MGDLVHFKPRPRPLDDMAVVRESLEYNKRLVTLRENQNAALMRDLMSVGIAAVLVVGLGVFALAALLLK